MICYFKYENLKKKKILGRGIATATAEVRGHSPSSPHSPYALCACIFSIRSKIGVGCSIDVSSVSWQTT